MNITITGGTGFLGTHLVKKLLQEGHDVSVVSRSQQKVAQIWGGKVSAIERDALYEPFPAEELSGVEVVIHLMGASLVALRWTKKKKQLLWESRVATTEKLVAALPESCHTFVCGSAIGRYPSEKNQVFTESTENKNPDSFLQQLCHEREEVARSAKTMRRRVISLRTGLVLGKDGGLLPKIAQATRRGGGVVVGERSRPFSRISIDDRVGGVMHCLKRSHISGPVNLTSPQYVSFGAFTHTVAQQFHRPVWLYIPGRLLRRVMGGAAELFTSWQEVSPDVLLTEGYVFEHPALDAYLKKVFS